MFEKDVLHIQGTLAQQTFLYHLYDGLTKEEACAQMLINPGAVAFVRRKDPAFNAAIRDAEGSRMDGQVDRLLTIHEDHNDPLMARVVSDNIKWMASKRMREIYGDKVDHVVEHKISLITAISDARTRTLQFIEGKSIELLDSPADTISVKPQIIDVIETEKDDPFA